MPYSWLYFGKREKPTYKLLFKFVGSWVNNYVIFIYMRDYISSISDSTVSDYLMVFKKRGVIWITLISNYYRSVFLVLILCVKAY